MYLQKCVEYKNKTKKKKKKRKKKVLRNLFVRSEMWQIKKESVREATIVSWLSKK